MNIRPFRAVLPNLKYVASPQAFFSSVREKYPDYKKGNFFKKAAKEAIYITQIKRGEEVHQGLITCTHIDEFTSGRIKKHENTLRSKEQQQIDLILKRGASVKPVLVFHKEVKKISDFISNIIASRKKIFEVKFNALESHKIWSITDGDEIEQICKLFKKLIPFGYIADGHHRSSSTALMSNNHVDELHNPYEFLMTSFFPSNQLQVFDFNRIVNALADISATKFVVKLSKYCDIEPLAKGIKPNKKFEMTMLLKKEWYALKWKKKYISNKKSVLLDANLLNKYILDDILNIEDVRIDTRIKYFEGVKPLSVFRAKCNKMEHSIGFILYPVDINDLIEIADNKKIMPPKSTWFEPRMKNGLVVQEF